MRKALGLLACTTFAAAGLWSIVPGSATRPASADQPNSGTNSRTATTVADSRSSSTLGRLNPFTRSSSSKDSKDGYRQQATKMLDDAQALAFRGDVAGARRLAERAQSFPIDWAPNERSPEKFLTELDAATKGRPAGASAPTTQVAKRPTAPNSSTPKSSSPKSGSSGSLASLESMTNKKSAPSPIAQVSNREPAEELLDEPAEETADELLEVVEQPATRSVANSSVANNAVANNAVAAATPRSNGGKQPAGGSLAEAKQLMQQARREMANGNLDAARAKADQAQSLNVAYGVFDERPEQVLAQIERLENNNHESAPPTQNIAKTPKKTAKPNPVEVAFEENPFEEEAPARASSAKKSSPKAAPAPVQSLAETGESDAEDNADSGELKPTNNDKQLSQQLLSQAQAAINNGNLEQARTLALQAQELDVPYGLFDIRPDHVIAKIDRVSNNLTIAKNSQKAKESAKQLTNPKSVVSSKPVRKVLPTEFDESPFATLASGSSDPDTDTTGDIQSAIKTQAKTLADDATDGANELVNKHTDVVAKKVAQGLNAAKATEDKATTQVRQQAMTALQQARQEMQAGKLDAARQKVVAVQKLNATYGLWDDRPEALLEEIDRAAIAMKSPTTPKAAPDQSKAKAIALMKQARADLAAGRIEEAKAKAEQADAMNVAFDVFDDRPDLVMNAIQRASHKSVTVPPEPEVGADKIESNLIPLASQSKKTILKGIPETSDTPDSSAPLKGNRLNPVMLQQELATVPPAEEDTEDSSVAAVHPEGPSAEELFREGQIHLNTGNRGAAYQAFLKSYQSGQKLDARRSQQLQDYLRELSPRRGGKGIQLASGQAGTQLSADENSTEPREFDLQRPINVASDRQKVQLDKLRNEVLNAIYRAERLKEQKDPTKALDVIDHAMASIESSGLDKPLTASLSSTLLKSRVSIEATQKLQEPNLAQKNQNDEVKQSIVRERDVKVRVERELANLVKQFNELMDQKRYAEAEVVAKQAKDLDSDNPVVETLVYKSQLARRVDSNDRLKAAKEEGFWGALDSTEWSAVAFDDRKSVEFGKDWETLKKRRNGKYGPDTRIRSPEEQRIEQSLTRPISLHFENAPLKKVIEHLGTIADVNVVLDAAGLEEESLSVSTPVSINVDSIKMKSALNLILEPLNLGYTIKNEVLQITSEHRLQGQLVPITYSVADLVVSIQPTQSASPFANINGNQMGGAGFAGGQMSVSPTGGSQGGQFQVAGAQSPASSTPWLASASPQWNQSPHNNGHDFRELIDLITTTCEPSSWQEVGGAGHCKGNDSTLSLVIRQTQKVHDEIRDLLEQLRRLQDLQVTIEVRFIAVSDTFFERIGIDFSFDVQDSLGGPNLINGSGGGQQGGQGGQGGQQAQGGGLIPAPPFGSIISGGGQQQQGQQGQQGGQQGQQGQQGQGGGSNFFTPGPSRQFTDRDNYGRGGKILGMNSSNSFTQDQDIAFRQGSFAVGVPDFGRFDANAGLNVGFAILSDIETFFFINAAQGDRRSNIMSAPKVTLFNGQSANVFDGQNRPFVTSLIPVVGAFAVGYQPQLTTIQDGVGMSVVAVISADRRFVRLQVTPFIQQIVDVVSFSYVSAGTGGQQGQQGGQGGQGGGQGGGGQQGFGGIGGGTPVMQNNGLHNDGLFGRAMAANEDYANVAQSGFGGIGGNAGLHVLESVVMSQNQGGGGFGGGGGQGGQQGGQGGQQGGIQAAGAGTVSVQLPVVASTQVGTVVSVPDGGTVLLGGVKRLRESRNMAGVPILNKIPYISRLFKNTGVGRETSSLMLMVTPRIVILEEEEALLGIPN